MANAQEQILRIPVIVVPIEVQLTLAIVLVENEHVPIAIDVINRALYPLPSIPPPFEYS